MRRSAASGAPLALGPDARIAVIGGGPAGSYFVLSLLDLARRHGRPAPQVSIFEHKRFSDAGPKGCNSCAGIVQSCMIEKVARLDIPLIPTIVQGEVRHYLYHTRRGETIKITSRPSIYPIIATYRGNGPAFSPHAGNRSYDDYMLSVALERGARGIHGTVTGIRLPSRPEEPIRVDWRQGQVPASEEFDLVVCAGGLNPRLLDLLGRLGFGYQAPRTLRAFQAELPVPADLLGSIAGDVNVFGPCLPGLAFAAFVPKQEFLTLSMVGFRDITVDDMHAFLSLPAVRAFLPPDWAVPRQLCVCRPRVAVTSSRQPFTDRLVIVGDANCGRLYKGGIDSAYLTASFAAEAALLHGVDRDSLQRYFFARCLRHIVWDNWFGEWFFRVCRRLSRWPLLEEAHLEVARSEGKAARMQQEIMWGLFTGEESYGALLRKSFHPRLLGALSLGVLRAFAARQLRKASASPARNELP